MDRAVFLLGLRGRIVSLSSPDSGGTRGCPDIPFFVLKFSKSVINLIFWNINIANALKKNKEDK